MLARLLVPVALLGLVCVDAAAQFVDEFSRREARRQYRAGQEFLSREEFEKAAEAFQRAIAADPLWAIAHYGLGQSYMALRRYGSAVEAFRRARETYERLALLAQGHREAVERQRDDELRELRETIRSLQTTKIKTATGDIQAQILRLESRIRDLERMKQREQRVFPVPAEVLLALGSAYFRNGELNSAEQEWKTAVSINPSLGEAFNNLAVLYMLTGRKREAHEAIESAARAGFRVHPQLKEDIRRMP